MNTKAIIQKVNDFAVLYSGENRVLKSVKIPAGSSFVIAKAKLYIVAKKMGLEVR